MHWQVKKTDAFKYANVKKKKKFYTGTIKKHKLYIHWSHIEVAIFSNPPKSWVIF